MTLYAIGDIHGQLDALRRAHDLIARDAAKRPGSPRIVHVGDYVDRGPDSRGVVEYLRVGAQANPDWVVLRGNHDRMFTRFMRQGVIHDARILSGRSWLTQPLGGLHTLASYGVIASEAMVEVARAEALDAVPDEHVAFLESRPLWFETADLLFVHAGIRPGLPIQDQDEDDLVWIREGFLDDDRDHRQLIVHGHTALDAPVHFGNRVDLDGGAGYGRPLVPAVFEDGLVFTLTDAGRVPLTPA